VGDNNPGILLVTSGLKSLPMKTFYKLRTPFLLMAGVWLLWSCGSSDLSPEEKVTKLLSSGTWQSTTAGSSIKIGPDDVTDDFFQGFTLRFTKDQFFTTGNSPVWLAQDIWHFKQGSKAGVIVRGMDDREITIVEVSSTVLKFSLEWDQTTYGGKTSSLPGVYEFTLTK
jgi:hypothetical protein